MSGKRYIVTERQLQKLKELLETFAGYSNYFPDATRELCWAIEDIESQVLTFSPAIERLAQELAHKVRAEMLACGEETFPLPQSILRHHAYMQSIAVASMFLPCLTELYWGNLWNEALEAEKEKAGGAYDVFMKALEGKDA